MVRGGVSLSTAFKPVPRLPLTVTDQLSHLSFSTLLLPLKTQLQELPLPAA